MEVLVIILIAGAAIAAVLVPLLQRGPAGDPMLDTSQNGVDERAAGSSSSDALEQEIRRYREALRANTVCRRCGAANPAGSRFCAECGRPVGNASARRAA